MCPCGVDVQAVLLVLMGAALDIAAVGCLARQTGDDTVSSAVVLSEIAAQLRFGEKIEALRREHLEYANQPSPSALAEGRAKGRARCKDAAGKSRGKGKGCKGKGVGPPPLPKRATDEGIGKGPQQCMEFEVELTVDLKNHNDRDDWDDDWDVVFGLPLNGHTAIAYYGLARGGLAHSYNSTLSSIETVRIQPGDVVVGLSVGNESQRIQSTPGAYATLRDLRQQWLQRRQGKVQVALKFRRNRYIRMFSFTKRADEVLALTPSGEELLAFGSDFKLASELRIRIAEGLNVKPAQVVLLSADKEITDEDLVDDVGAILARVEVPADRSWKWKPPEPSEEELAAQAGRETDQVAPKLWVPLNDMCLQKMDIKGWRIRPIGTCTPQADNQCRWFKGQSMSPPTGNQSPNLANIVALVDSWEEKESGIFTVFSPDIISVTIDGYEDASEGGVRMFEQFQQKVNWQDFKHFEVTWNC